MIRNMGRDKIAALARVLQMDPVEFVPGPESEANRPYLNQEDQDRLEALHQNPALGLLFDRTRKMSHDDVEFMLQFADRILKERDGDD